MKGEHWFSLHCEENRRDSHSVESLSPKQEWEEENKEEKRWERLPLPPPVDISLKAKEEKDVQNPQSNAMRN